MHVHGTRRFKTGQAHAGAAAGPRERLPARHELGRMHAGDVSRELGLHLERELPDVRRSQRATHAAPPIAPRAAIAIARISEPVIRDSRGRRRSPPPRPAADIPGWSGSDSTSSQMRSATGHCAGCSRGERGLARNRDRVVDQRFDASRLQVRLQRVAIAAQDRKQVIDVAGDRARDGTVTCSAAQAPAVLGGELRAARAVQPGSHGSRARRIAACISSSREFTPNSP